MGGEGWNDRLADSLHRHASPCPDRTLGALVSGDVDFDSLLLVRFRKSPQDFPPLRIPAEGQMVEIFAGQIHSRKRGSIKAKRETSEILEYLQEPMKRMRVLYDLRRQGNPDLKGWVTVRFTILPSGRVRDAEQVSEDTGSPDFNAEILEICMALEFPAISGSGNEIVTVPFRFSE